MSDEKGWAMRSLSSRILAFVVLSAAASASWAQSAIVSINSSQQAGSEVIRIEMSEALTQVPAGFTVQAPPRVAIDLPGVSNGLGKSMVEVNQGNLRSVNVAQSGDRTRLVMNLKQPAGYRAQIDGKVLVITLDNSALPAIATASGTTRFAESLNRTQLPLRDIDFRRGSDGAGRVIVDLPNNQVGVDIRQQGQGLIVEFLRSSLPDNLRRRLDVTDFGTPVQSITTTQVGDRVRMTVDPRGSWEHSAYQTENQFVLEVRAQKIDPNKLVQGAGYAGEKLSLNFQNIEVRALLQVIADFTNFNVVTSDTVTGSVTLRLKDVPWDQALDIILQAKNLGLRKSGNVILIAPKDELNAKEKIELESKQQISALEPLRTQGLPAELREGAGRGQRADRPIVRRRYRHRLAPALGARQRRLRNAHQPAVRERHPVQARRGSGPHRQDRHRGAAGSHRVAHRHRRRQLRPIARCALGRRRPARRARRHTGIRRGR